MADFNYRETSGRSTILAGPGYMEAYIPGMPAKNAAFFFFQDIRAPTLLLGTEIPGNLKVLIVADLDWKLSTEGTGGCDANDKERKNIQIITLNLRNSSDVFFGTMYFR